MSTNKFLKGVFYGAIVGGALTLLDKEVRDQAVGSSKKMGNTIREVVTNPKETVQQMQEKLNGLRNSYQNLNNDLQFIMDKATEIKELSQETANIVTDAKSKFIKE